ncbi:MAG: hypothetical protein EOM25_12780, partial [Deltaproteobacteria bacterium]|nr:hypothetical protein [Deltaproteobacteria bacterium]
MIKSAIPGLLAVLLCIGAARGDDGGALLDRLTVTGWLETVQSIRLSPPNDQVTSRAKLRLETS